MDGVAGVESQRYPKRTALNDVTVGRGRVYSPGSRVVDDDWTLRCSKRELSTVSLRLYVRLLGWASVRHCGAALLMLVVSAPLPPCRCLHSLTGFHPITDLPH